MICQQDYIGHIEFTLGRKLLYQCVNCTCPVLHASSELIFGGKPAMISKLFNTWQMHNLYLKMIIQLVGLLSVCIFGMISLLCTFKLKFIILFLCNEMFFPPTWFSLWILYVSLCRNLSNSSFSVFSFLTFVISDL